MTESIVSLERSILDLVYRFVDRQQVTLEAFRELRPAIVDTKADQAKLIDTLTQYINHPWQGNWHEWSFHFHGLGCRLINNKTAEIIEWEAPDVNTFDRFWFVNWLEWLWMFHPDDENLKLLKDFYSHRPNRYDLYDLIFPMLNLLRVEGQISQDRRQKNIYTLIQDEQTVSH